MACNTTIFCRRLSGPGPPATNPRRDREDTRLSAGILTAVR